MPKKTIGNDIYSLELDKVAGWNRQTVADGVWLNNNTIRPLDKNEEVLAEAICDASAELHSLREDLETSATELNQQIFNSSSYLQKEVDLMKAATDVIMVYGTYAAFEANSGELLLTDLDVVKVLHDESQAGKDQVYYQWTSANNQWTDIGSLDPYYNTTEIDQMFNQTSSYINQTSSQLYDWLEDSASTLHQEVNTVSSDLFGKLQTSANTLHNEISTVSSDLNSKLTTSAAKLKDEIDFTSAWLDSAYAVNGSEYIDVTSGADVFGKQQTFTVGLKDEPYELDEADENVRIYEENNKTLVSAYPWNTFYAIPEVTEFDEIKAAYDKGHTILLKDENKIFVLDSETSTAPAGSFFFVSIGYDIIEKAVGPESVGAGVEVESWECFNSYGHTNWKHLIGYSGRELLATTDYVDYISSATSGNAFAKSSAYTNSTSAELYSLMQSTSGKTDVSGSLFIKSSKTTKPDGTNTFTMELDTGKFIGDNIRITSASNGMTFSAKNYDQAILDTSANAVSVANSHADAASGFALNQAKSYARDTSASALDQAKAYARETSASSLAQAKTYAETASGAAYNKSKSDLGTVSAATYNKSKTDLGTVSADLNSKIPLIEEQAFVGGKKTLDKIFFNRNTVSDEYGAVSGSTTESDGYDVLLGYMIPNGGSQGQAITKNNGQIVWGKPYLGAFDDQDSSDPTTWVGEHLNTVDVEKYANGEVSVAFKSKENTSTNKRYLVPAPTSNKMLVTDSNGGMYWSPKEVIPSIKTVGSGGHGPSYSSVSAMNIWPNSNGRVTVMTEGGSDFEPMGHLAPVIESTDYDKALKVDSNGTMKWTDIGTPFRLHQIPYKESNGTQTDTTLYSDLMTDLDTDKMTPILWTDCTTQAAGDYGNRIYYYFKRRTGGSPYGHDFDFVFESNDACNNRIVRKIVSNGTIETQVIDLQTLRTFGEGLTDDGSTIGLDLFSNGRAGRLYIGDKQVTWRRGLTSNQFNKLVADIGSGVTGGISSAGTYLVLVNGWLEQGSKPINSTTDDWLEQEFNCIRLVCCNGDQTSIVSFNSIMCQTFMDASHQSPTIPGGVGNIGGMMLVSVTDPSTITLNSNPDVNYETTTGYERVANFRRMNIVWVKLL